MQWLSEKLGKGPPIKADILDAGSELKGAKLAWKVPPLTARVLSALNNKWVVPRNRSHANARRCTRAGSRRRASRARCLRGR